MVNVADTLFYDSSDNEYKQGGDLSSLRESGQHTEFDLGRIETWPGFDDLPEGARLGTSSLRRSCLTRGRRGSPCTRTRTTAATGAW